MNGDALVGFRVVMVGASDTFELKQAAIQCAQILRRIGRPVQCFRVIRRGGVERLVRLPIPRPKQ